MKKKSVFAIFALFALSAFVWYGGGLVRSYFFSSEEGALSTVSPAAGAEGHKAAGQPVSSLVIAKETIAYTQSLPGRISAFRQSQVRPQVNGIITARLFEEGATVEKGQQLYQIDDARYKAALASAEADLKSAEANIKAIEAKTRRYEELVKINAVSKQEYDDVKAQLDQALAAIAVAKAVVDVAQVNLDYTKVYAPISGRIGRTLVTEGALVTANQENPLAVITQLDPVYIDMQQPGNVAMTLQARLSGRNEVPVSLMLGDNEALPYGHTGVLKFSEVTIEETTGSVTLRAIMPNPEGVLLPGLFVRAVLDFGEEQALLVPQRATTRSPEGTLTVWVIDDDNKASPQSVDVRGAYKDSWIVSAGLEEGDEIIVEGYQKVAPGARVSPAPWLKQADTQGAGAESLTGAAAEHTAAHKE